MKCEGCLDKQAYQRGRQEQGSQLVHEPNCLVNINKVSRVLETAIERMTKVIKTTRLARVAIRSQWQTSFKSTINIRNVAEIAEAMKDWDPQLTQELGLRLMIIWHESDGSFVRFNGHVQISGFMELVVQPIKSIADMFQINRFPFVFVGKVQSPVIPEIINYALGLIGLYWLFG